ncbi:Salicylate hydroxylase [Leucoagaricus sp. SymC.cos]|nr:Salicylate hydroxylase [Leucoagaricus sp. SymC.cos]
MSSDERTRIAIVYVRAYLSTPILRLSGAGIAGLTLAIGLNAFDKERRYVIDMYECTPELSEIGAGIMMYPKTLHILEDIGVSETLIPCFDHPPDLIPRTIFSARKVDHKPHGKHVLNVTQNGGSLPLHRADLQRSLVTHLPKPDSPTPCTLHLSWRLLNYTQESPSGPITLHFASGVTRTCDILIGADGIKSTIRQIFLSRFSNPEQYQRYMEPLWAGTYAYRGLVSMEALAKEYPNHRLLDLTSTLYISKNKYSVVYPVSGGRGVNIVATIFDKEKENTVREGPWQAEATQEEFAEAFAGWEDEFQALIKCTEKPTRWALHNLDHLDICAKGRVIMIGDAAHGMVPHLGAGAGTGIDVSVVFYPLRTRPDIDNVVEIYNSVRGPRGVNMSKASIHQGHLYYFEGQEFDNYKEGDEVPWDLVYKTGLAIQENWDWTADDPKVERRRTEALFEERQKSSA